MRSPQACSEVEPDAVGKPVVPQLPDDVCQRLVYTHIIRGVSLADSGALRPELCPAPVSAEKAVSLGLPGWDDGLERFAQQSWRSYCRRSRKRQQ